MTKETTIVIEANIYKTISGEMECTEMRRATLTLSEETKMRDISEFTQKACALIRRTIKLTALGAYCYVDISRALYEYENLDDLYKGSKEFKLWSARGEDISEDGVYFSPSKQYNADELEHDILLTGKDKYFFEELTI